MQLKLMTITPGTYKPLCNAELHPMNFHLCYPNLLEGFSILFFVVIFLLVRFVYLMRNPSI